MCVLISKIRWEGSAVGTASVQQVLVIGYRYFSELVIGVN